jgi:YVTN family beta-propeller protein
MPLHFGRSTRAAVFFLMLLNAAFDLAGAMAAPQTPFKVQDSWKLGGDGSWDYLTVDASTHLLYIARLNRIMVVDTQTGKLFTEISGLQHAHGIAFDDSGQVGYITDGGAGSVVVFDRATHKAVATIPAGKNPDAIVFEPTQHRVFAFNGASKDATVIDASSNKVIATLAMPGKPEFSVTDGSGNVFVNIEDTNQVLRVDAAALKITASWSLAPCQAPTGLAIDIARHRLFSVCDNAKMAIVDSESGKLVTTCPIGEGADAVAYDSQRGLVLSSNGETGNLTILHQGSPDNYTAVQTLNTLPGARTLALNSTSGEVYTVSAKLGRSPAPNKQIPKPKPVIVPDSFVVLVIGRQ